MAVWPFEVARKGGVKAMTRPDKPLRPRLAHWALSVGAAIVFGSLCTAPGYPAAPAAAGQPAGAGQEWEVRFVHPGEDVRVVLREEYGYPEEVIEDIAELWRETGQGTGGPLWIIPPGTPLAREVGFWSELAEVTPAGIRRAGGHGFVILTPEDKDFFSGAWKAYRRSKTVLQPLRVCPDLPGGAWGGAWGGTPESQAHPHLWDRAGRDLERR